MGGFLYIGLFGYAQIASAVSTTQDHYQWYANANQLSPTSTLALEDASITSISSGTVLRLRVNVAATSTSLSAGTKFKLQYQANATSGSWTDIGNLASSTIWRTYNNTSASTTDGALLPYTLIPESNQVETYQEANPSTGTPNMLAIGSNATTGQYWTQATSGANWAIRHGQGALVYDGKMWVMGGATGTTYYNDVWYSTSGISWTQATSGANWSKRNHFRTLVYDNKMWVIGGYDGSHYNDVWYSSNGITWTQATSGAAWPARREHTSLVYDNKMWVMGGTSSTYMRDVWYSTNGVNWTRATATAEWAIRYAHASVVYDNKMWVMGGFGTSPAYKNDIWYSTSGISWTQVASNTALNGRYGHALLVYDNKMWVMGGLVSSTAVAYDNDIWSSTDGITWIAATTSAAWSNRYRHSSLVYDGKMWVIGASSNNAPTGRDVWYTDGNGVGEWDWTLSNNGAVASTTYYFRMIKSSGIVLDAYNRYPTLTTAIPPTITQEHYQWYENGNQLSPTSTLAFEDTMAFIDVASGTTVRLRMNIAVASATLAAGTKFKLQWNTSTSGAWTDVGNTASTTAWHTYNNTSASTTDGAILPYALLPESNQVETYQEANPSTGTPYALIVTSTVAGRDWTRATSGAGWVWRHYPGFLVYNGRMWILGGTSSTDLASLSDVWSSSNGIAWTQMTASAGWGPRSQFASLVYNDKMWVLGGWSDATRKNDVWYSSNGITWTRATSGAAWSPRGNHSAVVYKNKMWVMGGDVSGYANDVWYSTDGVKWIPAASASTTYYLSPDGNDSNNGLTPSTPWKTFGKAFSASKILKPGDALFLLDGTYTRPTTGLPSITCGTNANDGTQASPITIQAQNERKAFIKGDGNGIVFDMSDCSYYNIIGLRVEDIDNKEYLNSHETMRFISDDNVVVRRNVIAKVNRAGNNHVLGIMNTHDSLVEENEILDFHRHGIFLYNGANGAYNNTIRRNYVNSRGRCDLSVDGVSDYCWTPYQSCTVGVDATYCSGFGIGGDDGIALYPAHDNLIENNVVESTSGALDIETTEPGVNNRFLGNVVLNSNHGIKIDVRGNDIDHMPVNNTFIDTVLVGNTAGAQNWDVQMNGNKETHIKHLSGFPSGQTGFREQTLTTSTGDGENSFDLWDSIFKCISGTCSTGVWVEDPPIVGTLTAIINTVRAIGFTTARIPSGNTTSTTWTNFSTTDDGRGTCRLWCPDGAACKGSASDGKDLGATILYKTENGALTNQPLWDQITGEFPHGAIIAGVNDTATSSVYNVHERLNVNTGGCSFPSGYSSAPSGTLWSERGLHSSFVYNNKMWVLGGFGGSDGSTFLNDVWSSDDGITWDRATSSAAWAARRAHRAIVYNNKMWVMGGLNSAYTYMNDVWFSSDGVSWTRATSGAAWAVRDGHAVFAHNGNMWVMGGLGGPYYNDVWYTSGNGSGEFDWTLQHSGVAASTTYYFRLIKSDGTPLNTYSTYPSIFNL